MRYFVDNMNWAATEDDIILLFSQFGPVDQLRLVFHADGVRRRNIVFIEL
jgi:RNA recognition motif-containing protein